LPDVKGFESSPGRYVFDNSASQTPTRFHVLQSCYDAATCAALADTGIAPGWSCWEVGAGGGSVAVWLAERVGPTGRVLVTDTSLERLDPTLPARSNVRVERHDVVSDPLPGNAFDLIHARLVLLHLPQRLAVLAGLISRLAPGGWLVLEEFDCRWTPVLKSRREQDGPLFDRVHAALLRQLTAAGADVAWGAKLYAAMTDADLRQVRVSVFATVWPGGGLGVELHRANTEQVRADLVHDGCTAAELDGFWALLDDPGFAVQSYPLVTAIGRRPDAGQ
jgi:ubiquinone/menaquinone biosynthesis C-methylase UbiE